MPKVESVALFIQKLRNQVAALDALQREASDLSTAGAISSASRDELVEILNDVAIGIDDAASRLAKRSGRRAARHRR